MIIVSSLPEDVNPVGGRWVYVVKYGSDGEMYKARYVAKGFSQVHGHDYDETFSPTPRMSSIRILMQIAVEHGLLLHQMDVKSAYLNANLDFDIFVQQPKGYEVKDSSRKLYWKLKKSLYGLKQSGRNWNLLLNDFFSQNGFSQILADPCVYISYIKTLIFLI